MSYNRINSYLFCPGSVIGSLKEGEKIMVETSFDRFLKEEKLKAEPRNP